jgi:hypothetical protein
MSPDPGGPEYKRRGVGDWGAAFAGGRSRASLASGMSGGEFDASPHPRSSETSRGERIFWNGVHAGPPHPVVQPGAPALDLTAQVRPHRRALRLTRLALGVRAAKPSGCAGPGSIWRRARWPYASRSPANAARSTPTTGRRRRRLVEEDTKTPASEANVGAAARTRRAITRAPKGAAAGAPGGPRVGRSGPGICDRRGTALEPRNVNRAWTAVCKRAGVRSLRVHD